MKGPVRLLAMASFQSSSELSATGAGEYVPALLKTKSSRPQEASTSRTACRTSSVFSCAPVTTIERSSGSSSATAASFCSVRPKSATRAPWARGGPRGPRARLGPRGGGPHRHRCPSRRPSRAPRGPRNVGESLWILRKGRGAVSSCLSGRASLSTEYEADYGFVTRPPTSYHRSPKRKEVRPRAEEIPKV